MASFKSSLNKTILSYGASEAIAKGLNLVLTLGLAKFIDIKSYGIVALLIALELVLTEVILLGQHTTLLRFYESFKDNISKLYSTSLTLIFVATCSVFTIYLLFSGKFLATAGVAIPSSSLLFLIGGVAIQCHVALYLAYLRSIDKVKEYGIIRVGYQLMKIATVIITAHLVTGASSYPIGVLVANLATLLVLFPRINQQTRGYSQGIKPSIDTLRQNIVIGFPLTAHSLIGVLSTVTDRFTINKFLHPEQLAIYSFAFTQGTAIFFVLNILSLAYVPRIYRNQTYGSESKKLLIDYYKVSTLGAIALGLVIYFAVYPISLYFVDAKYAGGKVIVALALISMIVRPIGLVGLYKLTLLGDVFFVPLVTLTGLAINIALSLTLTPIHGIEGAAASVVISQTIYGISLFGLSNVISARKLKTR